MYDIVQRHAFNTDMMGSMYSKSNFVRATVQCTYGAVLRTHFLQLGVANGH